MALVDPEDQVPRLQAFKAAHPEIIIVPPGRGDPFWTATRGGQVLATQIFLNRFLDKLDWLESQ